MRRSPDGRRSLESWTFSRARMVHMCYVLVWGLGHQSWRWMFRTVKLDGVRLRFETVRKIEAGVKTAFVSEHDLT